MGFQKASKRQARLRMALIGPSGSGKTYTALNVAEHLGKRVAVIDTERGSASKYAHKFAFDVLELESFHPQRYIDAIGEAERAGYEVLIIDSLSHAWTGRDGALELVDKAAKRQQSGNTFGAWREVTPLHNALVDAMLGARLHLIGTVRSKQDYVQEKDEKGRTVIRKVGLQPVQRDGLEYEFDVIGDLDSDHNLIVGKTRCETLDGQVFHKPGQDLAELIRAWLTDGETEIVPTAAQPQNGTVPHEAGAPACADCGEIIADAVLKGCGYTASQIVDMTVAAYGTALCATCAARRKTNATIFRRERSGAWTT